MSPSSCHPSPSSIWARVIAVPEPVSTNNPILWMLMNLFNAIQHEYISDAVRQCSIDGDTNGTIGIIMLNKYNGTFEERPSFVGTRSTDKVACLARYPQFLNRLVFRVVVARTTPSVITIRSHLQWTHFEHHLKHDRLQDGAGLALAFRSFAFSAIARMASSVNWSLIFSNLNSFLWPSEERVFRLGEDVDQIIDIQWVHNCDDWNSAMNSGIKPYRSRSSAVVC